MIQKETRETLLGVRDFLMRAALFQANEFSRDDVRAEARVMLKALDRYISDQEREAIKTNGASSGHKIPDIQQGERAVNQGPDVTRAPNFNQYFPEVGQRRGPGRPKKEPVAAQG